MRGRGTVVLDGAGDGLDGLVGEPPPQVVVTADDAARCLVMEFASFGESRVVVRGGGVCSLNILAEAGRHIYGPCDDLKRVVTAVCSVEGVVAGYYLRFDVFL